MEPILPEHIAGRYRVVGLLGEGGHTSVYRAHDERRGVERAVKVLPPRHARDGVLRRRFFREAEALALLRHPGVVDVHDVGEDDGSLYLVMDLLPGGSLAQRLKRSGPLSEAEAVGVLLPVLDAVEAAHRAGVVHRDLKPANILLDERGAPRLGDFGIACIPGAAGPRLTGVGAVMGSWPYMAPEQRASARDVDPRSDVYSAGATLFALCRAAHPRDIDVPANRERYRVGFSDGLWAVIARATERDPDERYAGARALAQALVGLGTGLRGAAVDVGDSLRALRTFGEDDD